MTPAPTDGRVIGVDIARCIALVGMIAVHVLPGVVDGEVQPVQYVAAGRASALFAVLAGVSLVLVAGTRSPLHGREWRGMVAGTAARAAAIAGLGLVLGSLDTGIAVILVYYAVLFVIAVPFLAVPTGPLVAVAGVWAAGFPLLSHLVRSRLPLSSYEVPALESLAHPGRLLGELLLTGYYPVLTWVPYLLLGVAVGRLDLRRTRTAGVLVGGGVLAITAAWSWSALLLSRDDVRAELVRSFSGVGWEGDLDTTLGDGLHGVTPTGSLWWLAVRAPHSGTTFDLLTTSGSACLVLGLCLLLGRAAPRLGAVVFGAGAMTLTLYSLHVMLRSEGLWDGEDVPTFLGHAALVLLLGAQMRAVGGRGPLEAAVGQVGAAARDRVASRR